MNTSSVCIEQQSSSWSNFYQDRINSSYQHYFEQRYKPMLDVISQTEDIFCVREEGVGIGSITKALLNKDNFKLYCGYDFDSRMTKLARTNVPGVLFYVDSILNHTSKRHADLAITHGVLEHFSNEQIKQVFERYNREGIKSIHYVPLDKYEQPSFGDERLLPYQHWLKLVNPKDYILFNDDYDLLLIK